ncbi:MAG: hypothetical protein GEU97_23900 [Actinophytocola sp.]|nr:hypothetical protein [Actinophytocola sp.]
MMRRLLTRAGAVVTAALAVLLVSGGVASAHIGGERELPEGVWVPELTSAPDGITAHLLRGRVPGVFVEVPKGSTLLVKDGSGTELAKVDATGSAANGTWLDQRLRLPQGPPDHDHGTQSVSWGVPATLDGEQAEFVGTTRWVPNTDPVGGEDDHGISPVALGVGGVGSLIAAGLGVWVWRRHRRRSAAKAVA